MSWCGPRTLFDFHNLLTQRLPQQCSFPPTAVVHSCARSQSTRKLLTPHLLQRRYLTRNRELRELVSSGATTVTVAGLVRSIRRQKKLAFAHISDGSTLEPIQAILEPEVAKEINNGSYVELSGRWQASPGRGQAHELQVEHVLRIGETSSDDYPIQKKSQTPDFLRSLPHLRFRTPLYSLLARTRSQLIGSVTDFYCRARPPGPAIQVHPPLITSSDCEGAGEVFVIEPKHTTPTVGEAGRQQKDQQRQPPYFRDPKYLTVSAQLHLEAYAAELGDVWALSPTFRAEESDTPRHLSEFYMLEAEFRSITSLKQLMKEPEMLIKHIINALANSQAGKDLILYHSDPKYGHSENETMLRIEKRWRQAMQDDWLSMTYRDAVDHLIDYHAAHPGYFVHPPNFDTGLQLEHERHLVSYVARDVPLFITDYPKHIKPFYMLPSSQSLDATGLQSEDTVACFDLLFPFGTAELVGGSLREHRLPNLVNAMREKGLIKQAHLPGQEQRTDGPTETSNYPFLNPGETLGSMQWYTDLRRFGTSPHGGFGMGFDRLLAYLVGINSVRDTVGFPRYFGRADC